jgi:hypothetical protein
MPLGIKIASEKGFPAVKFLSNALDNGTKNLCNLLGRGFFSSIAFCACSAELIAF